MNVFSLRVVYWLDGAGRAQVDLELYDKTDSGQLPDEITLLGVLEHAKTLVPELMRGADADAD
jgi:hypothetical protein